MGECHLVVAKSPHPIALLCTCASSRLHPLTRISCCPVRALCACACERCPSLIVLAQSMSAVDERMCSVCVLVLRVKEARLSSTVIIAGYTQVTVLTIPVQYTAGRNNRKGGAVRSFLRATSKNPRTHKFVRRLRKRYSKVGIRKSLQSYRREQNTRGARNKSLHWSRR